MAWSAKATMNYHKMPRTSQESIGPGKGSRSPAFGCGLAPFLFEDHLGGGLVVVVAERSLVEGFFEALDLPVHVASGLLHGAAEKAQGDQPGRHRIAMKSAGRALRERQEHLHRARGRQ